MHYYDKFSQKMQKNAAQNESQLLSFFSNRFHPTIIFWDFKNYLDWSIKI